jgi:predicted nucleic acid-binding protein
LIFIDTSAWVAIEDKKDVNHLKALQFKKQLLDSQKRLITTNYILDETYTLMLLDLGYTRTINFKQKLDDLIDSNLVIVVHVTPDIEKEGWEAFERFNKDKIWSFTDCISKVIMNMFNILEAFTFDRHFEQMRFIKKP